MFGMSLIQVILILLLVALVAYDGRGPQTQIVTTPLLGLLIGVILGDPSTGLNAGSTIALMSLGVVGLGGASVPNYRLTTVVTTIVAIQSGEGYEVGLTLGLPVGMLYVYLDVLSKTVMVGVANRSMKLIQEHKFDKAISIIPVGVWINVLMYVIPTALVIFAGQAVTQALVDWLPQWLYNGMKLAGKILPVTGMAILLNYMPVKKHYPYLILGFVLYSYFNGTILSIALIGFALAMIYYQRISTTPTASSQTLGGLEDE